MTTAFTGPLIPAQDFKITLPGTATVNDAGQVVVDLSGFVGGAISATTLSATGAVDFDSTLNVDGATTLRGTTIATGNLSATLGNITAAAGNLSATLGSVSAGTTVTAGTGVTATAGGVTASAGNIVATLGNITASAGNIAATLGSVTAPAVVASTSLTITGASVIGLEMPFTLLVDDLAMGGPYRFTPSVSGTIVKIISNLQAALSTGDATITAAIGGVAVTNGVVTITQAGSAAGDVDLATPTAANTVVANVSDVSFTVGGTNSASVGAQLTVVIRRSA